jgi:hypothetical protein
VKLWDKLRQKDRVALLRAGLRSSAANAGLADYSDIRITTDQELIRDAYEAACAMSREFDSLVKTLPSAPEALHEPFEVTHMILVGSDKAGALVMGSARINGAGEFSSHNMGVQKIPVDRDKLPFGSRMRANPVLRLPVTEHFIRVKARDYTLIRGADQHEALNDLLKLEPGLADAIGPAQPRRSQV